MAYAEGSELVVVGSGSLGLAFSALLALAGFPVTLLARQQSGTELLQKRVIRLEGALEVEVACGDGPASPKRVAVVSDAGRLPSAEGVVFTTKAHHLPAVANAVGERYRRGGALPSWVLGLQNGLGKESVLGQAFGPGPVVGATTLFSAERRAPGEVLVTGIGTTYLAAAQDASADPADPQARFLAASLPCEIVDDLGALVWTKLANAVGVFGVSALTRLPSIEVHRRLPLALAYQALLQEVGRVAFAEGVAIADFPGMSLRTYLDLGPERAAALMGERVAGVEPKFTGNSSMVQDLERERSTEVEEVFGRFVERARHHEVSVPLAEFVYLILSGLEQGSSTQSLEQEKGTSHP
ncbi:MAG: ketopantoate reductase family protein [Acidimicrobiaceae bacterium]|nr:ketopantoate reductase family protein [Acidimicrobiaceae bacterium]